MMTLGHDQSAVNYAEKAKCSLQWARCLSVCRVQYLFPFSRRTIRCSLECSNSGMGA